MSNPTDGYEDKMYPKCLPNAQEYYTRPNKPHASGIKRSTIFVVMVLYEPRRVVLVYAHK